MMLVVINVQLIGFGTVVILSMRMFISSLSFLITEPSRATALIPVRLAYDHFEDNTLPILMVFWKIRVDRHYYNLIRSKIRIAKKLISSTAYSCTSGLDG